MAEKRMFAKSIIDSDTFLEMPVSARLLYFDLSMRADDDGFINSPKKIMRMTGATTDDMNVLIARRYIIPFDSGIIVIRHWRINNYLRSDRYHETVHLAEKAQLCLEGNVYYKNDEERPQIEGGIPLGIPVGDADKNRVDKKRKEYINTPQEKKRFVPPTVEQVKEYILSRTNVGEKHPVDPEAFVDYYAANGWKQGKGKPIKDWQACVRTWERNDHYTFNGTAGTVDAKQKGRQ